jgi:hypothetical protein
MITYANVKRDDGMMGQLIPWFLTVKLSDVSHHSILGTAD